MTESSQAGTKAPLVKEELFATESLYKTGSISRGITVGNTNNLGVTSSLNLQLDGQLADDLFINAVITDQQVPFQPEGNTQQIQDFDKVLVNLYNDKFSLMAGDVVLRTTDGLRRRDWFDPTRSPSTVHVLVDRRLLSLGWWHYRRAASFHLKGHCFDCIDYTKPSYHAARPHPP